MLKVVNEHNDILAFLEADDVIPKWMLQYKQELQVELDLCRSKDKDSSLPQVVTVRASGDSFIFKGVFSERVSFIRIEPWKPKLGG